jgi:hypothetical protein
LRANSSKIKKIFTKGNCGDGAPKNLSSGRWDREQAYFSISVSAFLDKKATECG